MRQDVAMAFTYTKSYIFFKGFACTSKPGVQWFSSTKSKTNRISFAAELFCECNEAFVCPIRQSLHC